MTGDAPEGPACTDSMRFFLKVDFWAPNGCWAWTAFRNHGDYGTFAAPYGRRSKMVMAHRWCFEWTNGPIPDGLKLDHLCRVRHCVNPAHLEPVTNAENCRRGLNQGHTRSRGEACGQAKVTSEQVRQIRDRYALGGVRQCDLAAEYGISQVSVSCIVRRKSWAHL